jgi:hypothetical protein
LALFHLLDSFLVDHGSAFLGVIVPPAVEGALLVDAAGVQAEVLHHVSPTEAVGEAEQPKHYHVLLF